ncbi:MAG: hypothetical protein ACOX6Z_00865 [Dethiobacteria bacterium]|jgi:hypothetical protein
MTRRNCFYVFHGTTEHNALNIKQSKAFTNKMREDHWLGQGVYFFREDERQAFCWAKYKIKNLFLRGQKPAVVETIIKVGDLNFLNLDSREGLITLSNFIDSLKLQGICIEYDSTGKNIRDIKAKIRCFIMSMLPPDIWVIQRTFHVPSFFDNTVLSNMNLLLNGVQVCVRNCNVINFENIKIIRDVAKARVIDNIIIKECEEA